jgi:hypothetical protein
VTLCGERAGYTPPSSSGGPLDAELRRAPTLNLGWGECKMSDSTEATYG